MLDHLPWDSDFFHLHVGQVRLPNLGPAEVASLEAAAAAGGFDVAYVFSATAPEPGLDLDPAHWALVDTKVTFRKSLARTAFDPSPDDFTPDLRRTEVARDSDYDALRNLALAAGEHSRFRTDPRFGRARFEALYERWLERSLDGSFADYVLVTRDESARATGFVTGRVRGDAVEVGLIAVSAAARGQGLGRTLLDALVGRARAEHGVTSLTIPTQADNHGAMRFYQAYGMHEGQREWVFHYWP